MAALATRPAATSPHAVRRRRRDHAATADAVSVPSFARDNRRPPPARSWRERSRGFVRPLAVLTTGWSRSRSGWPGPRGRRRAARRRTWRSHRHHGRGQRIRPGQSQGHGRGRPLRRVCDRRRHENVTSTEHGRARVLRRRLQRQGRGPPTCRPSCGPARKRRHLNGHRAVASPRPRVSRTAGRPPRRARRTAGRHLRRRPSRRSAGQVDSGVVDVTGADLDPPAWSDMVATKHRTEEARSFASGVANSSDSAVNRKRWTAECARPCTPRPP